MGEGRFGGGTYNRKNSPHRFACGLTPLALRLAFPSGSQTLKGGVKFKNMRETENRLPGVFQQPPKREEMCAYPPTIGGNTQSSEPSGITTDFFAWRPSSRTI